MPESVVQKKLAKLVRAELSDLLGMGQEYVPGGMLTISLVRITGDLSIAKIYVTTLPDDRLAAAVDTLEERAWEVRKALAARIKNKVRKIPELRFYADDSFLEAKRIEKLLEQDHAPEDQEESSQ